MNIYRAYKRYNTNLISEFEASNEINHQGGKGAERESVIRNLLKKNLPKKFSLGSGDVISAAGGISKECDIIIYDEFNYPILYPPYGNHAAYAAESVFGVIEVKSNLDSGELKTALLNIRAAKQTVYQNGFSRSQYSNPLYGAIIGYSANRSIEAIVKQVNEHWDSLEQEKIKYFPDYIVVLDVGIIEPGSYNGKSKLYRTEQNTFLHFFSKTLKFLNEIELGPLDFANYIGRPSTIEGLLVEEHDKFIFLDQEGHNKIMKLTDETILKIYHDCQKQGKQKVIDDERMKTRTSSLLGILTLQYSYVFNPLNKQLIFRSQVKEWRSGYAITAEKEFFPQDYIRINRQIYYLDLAAMNETDFIENKDLTSGDLSWEVP